ncbi:DoxX family protein, partial [Nonlabens ulvanivorans]|uniref:DoxX family protein n=1 Tax=Nonlabens ulvanivorans TaxID=906888 RepID=UPI003297BE38
MVLEFERFGIPQYRNLTGILQILGGLSIILGLYTISILGFMGALGLSLLMFLGFGVYQSNCDIVEYQIAQTLIPYG